MSIESLKENTYFSLNNELNLVKDGKIQLHKDAEAVKAYFDEHVNKKLRFFHDLEEKLEYLTTKGYIDGEMLSKYDPGFVKELFRQIYKKEFRFKTFMGAYKFYDQYAMKDDQGNMYLEKYEDRLAFNALELANGDEELATSLADMLISQEYQPATPTFLNAGKLKSGEKVSCFLVHVSDDMNSIGRSINSALQLSKIGGGVGINLTDLRPSGDPIKGVRGRASGVVPVMKQLEDAFMYSNQLGQRQGAGVVYLNIFHKDILDMLATRKENADEKVRIKMLSLGVVVPDKFYELCKKDSHMYLFSPYDIKKEYGVPMSQFDISERYDELVDNPNIHKSKIRARDLEIEISKLWDESGYPFLLNIDHANKANPLHGKIQMSNLCTEILQVQSPSVINDEQGYDTMGTDISCNLGSTNVLNLMKTGPEFGTKVRTMLRALSSVSESSSINVVPSIKKGNDLYHSVGLGAMNLHGFLAVNKVMYESPEAREFSAMYFQLLNYWTLFESNQIAKEKGESFYQFELSEYANGVYFDKYKEHIKYSSDMSETVAKLFDGIQIPTQEDWKSLQESIEKDGLYNSYRLAVAPTGSIAYVNEATASIHPIIHRVEERQEGKRGKVYYPATNLSDETIPYYTSAYDVNQLKMMALYAEVQKHVDQGISMTIFTKTEFEEGMYPWKVGSKFPTKKTTRDLNMFKNFAWQRGLKTIYYVRTYKDDEEFTNVNECESCSI